MAGMPMATKPILIRAVCKIDTPTIPSATLRTVLVDKSANSSPRPGKRRVNNALAAPAPLLELARKMPAIINEMMNCRIPRPVPVTLSSIQVPVALICGAKSCSTEGRLFAARCHQS